VQWDDSLFVHLYLPSMQHFSEANAAYLEIIPPINPPARACVQLDSLPGAPDLLIVEIIYRRRIAQIDVSPANDVSQRKVLHVQSISKWAPSCIGPYSQAVMHNKFVYLAGQIPLVPETMQVLASCDAASKVAAVTAQLQLVLRHCTSVAIAMQTDFVKYLLWGTLYFSRKAYVSKSALTEALTSLQSYLDQHGRADDRETDDEGKGDIQMDSYLLPPSGVTARYWEPLVLWVALPSLPRGVDVELQPVVASLSHMKNRAIIKLNNDCDANPDSEEEEDEGQCEWTVPGDTQLTMERVQLEGEASHTSVQMLYYPGTEAFFRAHALITLPSGDDQNSAATVARAIKFLDEEAWSKMNQSECGNWGLESCQHSACGVPNIKIYISLQKLCCVGVDDFRRSLPAWLQGLATIIPVIGIGNLNGVEGDLGIEYFLSMQSQLILNKI
jgi:enamine deaminase RidA (YjgF/YER057c/UK114 family)